MRRVAKDDRRVSRHAWLLVVCVRRIARHEHAFALGQRAALGPASVEEGVGLATLVHDVHVARALVVLELELQPRAVLPVHCHVAACGATVRGTYGTPGAGTRTVHILWHSSCPVPQVRTLRRRRVRVACTYSTEAPGQHKSQPAPLPTEMELERSFQAPFAGPWCLSELNGTSFPQAGIGCALGPRRWRTPTQRSAQRRRRARAVERARSGTWVLCRPQKFGSVISSPWAYRTKT